MKKYLLDKKYRFLIALIIGSIFYLFSFKGVFASSFGNWVSNDWVSVTNVIGCDSYSTDFSSCYISSYKNVSLQTISFVLNSLSVPSNADTFVLPISYTFSPVSTFYSSSSENTYQNYISPTFRPSVSYVNQYGNYISCQVGDGSISCPVGISTNINQVKFSWYNAPSSSVFLSISLYGSIEYYQEENSSIVSAQDKTTSAVESNTQAIEKQTEATNKQTEEITSTDSDESSSSAESIFSDTSAFEKDDYSLYDILILPYTLMNTIANSSGVCQPLKITLPYFDEEVSIPCVSTFVKSFSSELYSVLSTIMSVWLELTSLALFVKTFYNCTSPDDKMVINGLTFYDI